jgi:3-hydroxymyristoyl/3-hydroxydecanoyl-(acyl carrier protein) dehydratase
LLPGVLLLSLVMETLAQAPWLQSRMQGGPRIDNVKFLAPVGPGAVLEVLLRPQGSGLAFELRQGPQTVARGQLAAGPVAGVRSLPEVPGAPGAPGAANSLGSAGAAPG